MKLASMWTLGLMFAAALGAIAVPLGPQAFLWIALIVICAQALGQLVTEILDLDAPFLGFVLGFCLLAYGVTFALRLLPTYPFWIAALLCAITAMIALSRHHRTLPKFSVLTTAMLALFTLFWSLDMAPRLAVFTQTGRLDFWVDIFVHAGKLSELGGIFAAGRGNTLMADFDAPLYHIVSYAPAGLIMALTQTNALATAILIWIPLGVLVMGAGMVALGHALGGARTALWTLPALALMPALDGIPLHNGLFSFPWLMETGAGALYGLGLSTAALALLIHWFQTGQKRHLAAALLATAAVFLIRVNFFVWLAPLVVLSLAYSPSFARFGQTRWFQPLGLLGLVTALIALSWTRIAENPELFLIGFLKSAHIENAPTAYEWLFADLTNKPNQALALIISAPLMLFAIGGVWFILYMIARRGVIRLGQLQSLDGIPRLTMWIACIFAFLGPMPSNGDLSEFRHRAGPLLLAVLLVWSVHFMVQILGPKMSHFAQSHRVSRLAVIPLAIFPLLSLPFTILHAKTPQMNWGHSLFGLAFSPDLTTAAKALATWSDRSSRFAVAGQSADARLYDPAVVILAQSGVPAFLSCPQSILLRQDVYGDEARRRMQIMANLDKAATLDDLYAQMAANGLTDYIVTDPNFAAFDPDRKTARFSVGQVAIYTLQQN